MPQSIDTMSVRDAINGRCSVRAYAPEKIDQPSLQVLLAAAVRAPTAMHGEPWEFVIVQDIDRLKRLSDRAKVLFSAETKGLHPDRGNRGIFSQPDFNVFHDAGTLVVICAKTAGQFAQADCWLAAENLMLAAHAMGLGTCVIGSATSALNLPDVKQELGIPPETTAVAPIIVGRPRGETRPSARKDPHVVAWR
jgi:nitroreductase